MSRKLRDLVLATFVIVLTGVASWYLSNSAPAAHLSNSPTSGFNFNVGEHGRYSFMMTTRLGSGRGSLNEEHQIESSLFTRIIEVHPNSVWIGMQFRDLEYRVKGRRDSLLERELTTPFLARLSKKGQVEEINFSAALEPDGKEKLQGLIAPILMVYDSNAGREWQIVEDDSTGVYLARYQQGPKDQVSKRKLDYISLKSSPGVIKRVQVDPSLTRFRIAQTHSWLEELEGREELKFYGVAELQISAAVRTKLSYVSADSLGTDWDQFSVQEMQEWLNYMHREEPKPIQMASSIIGAESKQPLGLMALVDKLKGPMEPGDLLEATSALAAILKGSPDEIHSVVQVITAGEISQETRSSLIYALQKSGSEAAQKALVALAKGAGHGGEGNSIEDQKNAIIALGFVPLEQFAEDALWEIYNTRGDERSDQKSEVALLALGTLSDSVDEVSEQRSIALVGRLASVLDESSLRNSYDKMGSALLALGNSAQPEALPYLQDSLQHESDTVRLSAAKALRSFNDIEIVTAARERLLQEDAPQVRSALIDVLQSNETDEQTYQVVQQLVLEEDDPGVRLKFAKYIADNAHSFPRSRANITKLIELEDEPEIYKTLLEALAE